MGELALNAPEPMPTPTAGKPVWELVVEDMLERDRVGREKYGTPLQAHNGRRPLVDAYQEALDLAVYLRQAIEEREDAVGEAERLRNECHALRVENATLREDVRGIIGRECEALGRDLADATAKLAAVSEAFSQLHPTLRDRFEGTRSWPLVQALANALLGRDEEVAGE